MKIQESAENYLEAILMLQEKTGHVRSIDIANQMNFSKPSVSVAIKQFREHGYITVDGGGHIALTNTGMEIAKRIYERHNLLAQCLMALGVSEKTAFEDACRVEHDLSEESVQKIKEYYEKSRS